MPETTTREQFLDSCNVDAAVFELRPDYRALLLVVDGLAPVTDAELHATGDALAEALSGMGENVQVARRLVSA